MHSCAVVLFTSPPLAVSAMPLFCRLMDSCRGKWHSKSTILPGKWTLLVAQASHEHTDAKWSKSGVKLTGEVAGRQTWECLEEDASSSSGQDEALAFNPAVNPNSSDKLLRAQQVKSPSCSRDGDGSSSIERISVATRNRRACFGDSRGTCSIQSFTSTMVVHHISFKVGPGPTG